jgi:hypothetical protein
LTWLRSRSERASGITTWAVAWAEGGRGGKARTRRLGAVPEKTAEFEHAGRRTRAAKPTASAQRVVDESARHAPSCGALVFATAEMAGEPVRSTRPATDPAVADRTPPRVPGPIPDASGRPWHEAALRAEWRAWAKRPPRERAADGVSPNED